MKQKILVVDDDKLTFEVYKSHLEDLKDVLELDFISSPLEVLGAIAINNYRCIILDIIMPKLNGTELLAKIRRQYSKEELPIVVISSYFLAEDTEIDLVKNELVLNKYLLTKEQLVDQLNKVLNRKIEQDLSTEVYRERLRVNPGLLVLYIDEMKLALENLNNAVKFRNIDLVKEIAQKVKGSSSLIGQMKLMRLASIVSSNAFHGGYPTEIVLDEMAKVIEELEARVY